MTFEPTISVTVMYAPWVAWRAENAADIAEELRAVDSVSSVREHAATDNGDIWDDARECWLDGDAADSTHHIVIQGDVELCDGFGEAMTDAIRAVPNRMIGFYGNHKSIRDAAEEGHNWIRLEGGVWGQCVCVPSVDVAEMVEWIDYYFEDDFIHDDTMLAGWTQLAQPDAVWIPIPQLVEHKGADDSSMGHEMPVDFTAAVYAGDTDVDVREIDWTGGLTDAPYVGSNHRKPFPSSDGFRFDRLEADGYIQQVDK